MLRSGINLACLANHYIINNLLDLLTRKMSQSHTLWLSLYCTLFETSHYFNSSSSLTFSCRRSHEIDSGHLLQILFVNILVDYLGFQRVGMIENILSDIRGKLAPPLQFIVVELEIMDIPLDSNFSYQVRIKYEWVLVFTNVSYPFQHLVVDFQVIT